MTLLMRPSHTHPLLIAEVQPAPGFGKIGITFCPGKIQANAFTGTWARDLEIDLDLDAVRDWNAAAVVTLVEEHELDTLGVPAFGPSVIARNMAWYHLSIPDQGIPDRAFARGFGTASISSSIARVASGAPAPSRRAS